MPPPEVDPRVDLGVDEQAGQLRPPTRVVASRRSANERKEEVKVSDPALIGEDEE